MVQTACHADFASLYLQATWNLTWWIALDDPGLQWRTTDTYFSINSRFFVLCRHDCNDPFAGREIVQGYRNPLSHGTGTTFGREHGCMVVLDASTTALPGVDGAALVSCQQLNRTGTLGNQCRVTDEIFTSVVGVQFRQFFGTPADRRWVVDDAAVLRVTSGATDCKCQDFPLWSAALWSEMTTASLLCPDETNRRPSAESVYLVIANVVSSDAPLVFVQTPQRSTQQVGSLF